MNFTGKETKAFFSGRQKRISVSIQAVIPDFWGINSMFIKGKKS
jgi:hypothetical protein